MGSILVSRHPAESGWVRSKSRFCVPSSGFALQELRGVGEPVQAQSHSGRSAHPPAYFSPIAGAARATHSSASSKYLVLAVTAMSD